MPLDHDKQTLGCVFCSVRGGFVLCHMAHFWVAAQGPSLAVSQGTMEQRASVCAQQAPTLTLRDSQLS